MSKTYRRKNITWITNFNNYSWENGFQQTIPMNFDSKEFIKKKARFHSDNYGRLGVPHWYVNLYFERSDRVKTKKELHKWKKNPENYEVLLNRYVKDAGWSYW